MGRLLQLSIAEAAGGGVAGVLADSVLYAIDSAKVRAQHKSASALTPRNVSILFKGLVPTVMLGSLPVFGAFFLLYAPLKVMLQEHGYSRLLPVASMVCAVPATVIGVPADVLKKRLVLGIDPSIQVALARVTETQGVKGLFAGWHVNLIRDLPFSAIKIGLYEWFVYEWKLVNHYAVDEPITPAGASACGVSSGVACAVMTCPLDVVNTRIKAGGVEANSILQIGAKIIKTEGVSALFQGVVLRSVALGIGSSIFWPIQRAVAEALQPYESCPFLDEERNLRIPR
jgi:hypothetical protein